MGFYGSNDPTKSVKALKEVVVIRVDLTKNDCVKNNSTGYCKTDTNRRKVSRSQLAYITTEMLNEARYSRLRPGARGRGRGQELEAEAKNLRPRPMPTARGRGRGHMQKKKIVNYTCQLS